MTVQKIDHTFHQQRLSYDAVPNTQPCIKISFFFNKLPNVSYEQFHRHWETVHADLTMQVVPLYSNKIQRYVQVHATPEMKEHAKRLEATGMVAMEFDGCSEMYVRTFEDWQEFHQSPRFIETMRRDCKNFMAMPIQVMVGQENLVFGKALPEIGGDDGILLSGI